MESYGRDLSNDGIKYPLFVDIEMHKILIMFSDHYVSTFLTYLDLLMISCSADSDKTRPQLEMVNVSRDETGIV